MLCSDGLPDGFTDLELADQSNIKEWNVRMLPVSLSVIVYEIIIYILKQLLLLVTDVTDC